MSRPWTTGPCLPQPAARNRCRTRQPPSPGRRGERRGPCGSVPAVPDLGLTEEPPAGDVKLAVQIGFPGGDSTWRVSGRECGRRLRQAGSPKCTAGSGSGRAIRCSWTQLDLMAHDPEPAPRWPGTLRGHGRHTDRTRYSHGGKWRNGRSVAIPMGLDRLTVKPSAKPTLVRTQHLPLKTPGQTRCRCSRMPGLMRVRERFCRPFPVAVGQILAGQRRMESGCPGAPCTGLSR
jgi:hypothetical protein